MSLHEKMFMTLLLVLIIFLLLLNLVYDIKGGGQNRLKNILYGCWGVRQNFYFLLRTPPQGKNTDLVRETVLSQNNLKENSTSRQKCYQRLELRQRSLDVAVKYRDPSRMGVYSNFFNSRQN